MAVLLGRISQSSGQPWLGYLPDGLRPAECPAKTYSVRHEVDSKARGVGRKGTNSTLCSTSSEETSRTRHIVYQPKGMEVTGRVWELSQDAQGCREVQLAMDNTPDDDSLAALFFEFQEHEWEAMQCPHANHVLQKAILMLRPECSQFLIDVIIRDSLSVNASRHKYGCRVVQRLIEHCSHKQTAEMISIIILEATHIARHPYGNYVIQHLLQHGSDSQRNDTIASICRNIRGLCSDPYGCAVVSAAMTSISSINDREKVELAGTLIKEPALLVHLACSRHGSPAAKEVLQVLEDEQKTTAEAIFIEQKEVLLSSRYGRTVAAALGVQTCCTQASSANADLA